MSGKVGRPRVYDESWVRRGQRWPPDVWYRLEKVAHSFGMGREQFVAMVVDIYVTRLRHRGGRGEA